MLFLQWNKVINDMTLFLIALAILVGGYFIYGTLMERVIGCDPLREMPCYTKQDGTVRHAVGTLTGYQHSFHRPYMPRPENTFVVYYDLEAKGWRTFHAENFLCVE